jgi:hypothetical protein
MKLGKLQMNKRVRQLNSIIHTRGSNCLTFTCLTFVTVK